MRNIIAAFIFFTRLPLWRFKIFYLDAKYFKNVINYWAVTSWLTAGVMAGVLWLSAQIVAFPIAIIVAILARVLLTGALHEDGLADFFDGMGGGHNKEHILRIMKDSHIGTFGVLALIFYYLLFFNLLIQFDLQAAIKVILIADPLAKFIVSNITLFLPYARTGDTSKSGVVYEKTRFLPFLMSAFFGVLPLVILADYKFWSIITVPLIVFFALILFLKCKIGGYTGDTCGAIFLLCEISTVLAFSITTNLLSTI